MKTARLALSISMTPLIALLLITMADVSEARLGESKEECEARYGKAFHVEGETCVYRKGAFIISVLFGKDGKGYVLEYYYCEKKIVEAGRSVKEGWTVPESALAEIPRPTILALIERNGGADAKQVKDSSWTWGTRKAIYEKKSLRMMDTTLEKAPKLPEIDGL